MQTRQRRYAPRRMFIKEAAPLSSPDGKPNYLIAFQPLEKWPPGPECTGAPETWNGCVVDDRTGANYNLYEATLQRCASSNLHHPGFPEADRTTRPI